MKYMLENLTLMGKIQSAMEHHKDSPKLVTKMPLFVPITSVLMDDAHTMERRAKVLAATVTSFVAETAPAYKGFKPEEVKSAVSGAFDEAINIINQLKERVEGDENFEKTVIRNYKNDYEGLSDEPEDDDEVTIQKVREGHPLHAVFEQLITAIEQAERDTDAVRPLH